MEQNEAGENISESKSKSKNKIAFSVGIAVFLLAIVGVVSIVFFSVNAVKQNKQAKLQEEYTQYNRFLIPIAAIDMEPFDDISSADMTELVEMSVWSVLNSELDPNTLTYENGNLLLPQEMIEQAFTEFFGDSIKIEHCTVEGYGYEFTYDETTKAYSIPVTTISPVFTPTVTGVESKGGATVITCGMVNASVWTQNSETGELTAPTPDRYIKVTLRSIGKTQYISAVQMSGTTEIATTASLTEEEKESTEDTEETKENETDGDTETTEAEKTTEDETKITNIR